MSRTHVQRGVELGIAQIQHGKRGGLARMHEGDTLVYYSPRISYPDGELLQAFTAIGRVPDDEIWQADEGDFQPFRRRIDYEVNARELALCEVKEHLDLTSTPNWGYQLRRGIVALTDADVGLIRSAMRHPK